MTYFKEALSTPALHFKRLRLAEPLSFNGKPVVRRTHTAIETEIIWEGRRYLLYLPFHHQSIEHIEHLEHLARERSRGPLTENCILREELTMADSLGHHHCFDVILQALPSGITLKEAVAHYRADDLIAAVEKMKCRLDAIGFRHNNLTPSNIIVCDNGVVSPLRYWYAEWELFSDNDISQLVDFIESNRHKELDATLHSMLAQDCTAEYSTTSKHGNIIRLCRAHRYGFVDSDGVQIIPFIYSWASDFCEGRAIVSKGSKMGAIDEYGHKVIPVIYNSLEFDVETGFFSATRDNYRYLLNYEGEIVRRTKIEREESNDSKMVTPIG